MRSSEFRAQILRIRKGHRYNDAIAQPDIDIPRKKTAVVKLLVEAFLKVSKSVPNVDSSAIRIFKEICHEMEIPYKNVIALTERLNPSLRSTLNSVPENQRCIDMLSTLEWDDKNVFPFK